MSSSYVRNMFRAWLNALPEPYYDTVNIDQAPADDIWLTAVFISYGVDFLDSCDQQEETGEVQVVWFGRPGRGDADLLAAVESGVAAIMAQSDPAGNFVITGRTAVSDYAAADAPHFEMAVSFVYTMKL